MDLGSPNLRDSCYLRYESHTLTVDQVAERALRKEQLRDNFGLEDEIDLPSARSDIGGTGVAVSSGAAAFNLNCRFVGDRLVRRRHCYVQEARHHLPACWMFFHFILVASGVVWMAAVRYAAAWAISCVTENHWHIAGRSLCVPDARQNSPAKTHRNGTLAGTARIDAKVPGNIFGGSSFLSLRRSRKPFTDLHIATLRKSLVVGTPYSSEEIRGMVRRLRGDREVTWKTVIAWSAGLNGLSRAARTTFRMFNGPFSSMGE
ncbi:hypothetical protein C8R47DRAFT_1084959 [Mycena vitilis]|nr:hypothetical protein C8R47DRAFT_1084959 [Mycena vitilis]